MLRERTEALTTVVNGMDESDASRMKTAELNKCQDALFQLQEQRK